MARLISLYPDDGSCSLGRRELPVPFDENIAMVMKLPELNLNRPLANVKGPEMEAFVDKCRSLTYPELSESLKISSKDVFELIGQNVPCVGCRRSVERLFRELVETGQDALYPVTLTRNGILGLVPEVVASTSMLFILLKYYGSRLSTMVDSISTKSRQTRRCPLHSLDAHRARPTGLQWRPLWDCMAQVCREELTLVEADTLLDTMEAYLQKHRFCPECRLKVLRAYSLLVGEVEPSEEKGYKPILYLGLKCCPAEKHIHVQCNIDLISLLIARAEPELVGSSRRERHAKTMEVAQEEVVTCVGICLLERLQRVAQRLREEEQMVDMLQFASLQALRRSFELAVESKRGVSQLELLCEELSREEEAQKQRKEMKRLRRKKRRGKKEAVAESPAPTADAHSAAASAKIDGDGDDADDEIEPMERAVEEAGGACHCECSSSSSKDSCSSSSKSKATKVKAAMCMSKIKNRVNNNDDDHHHVHQIACSSSSSSSSSMSSSSSCSGSGWTPLVHRGGHCSEHSSRSSSTCSSSATKHSTTSSSFHLQSSELRSKSLDSTASSGTAATKTTIQVGKQATPHDSGYSSNNSSNMTTPEGSDVACTEGLCNHHSGSPVQCRPASSPEQHLSELFLPTVQHCDCGEAARGCSPTGQNAANRTHMCPVHVKLRDNGCNGTRSLQQMLDDWCVGSEEEDDQCFIPVEEVQAFRRQQQQHNEQRLQLRHDLRLKFDQLCGRLQTAPAHSN